MEHNYRISHHIGDSGFELESTDKDWVDKKEKEYLSKILEQPDKGTRILGKATKSEQEMEIYPPNMTINEFYKRIMAGSNVTSRPDMAVFFVYYLSKIEKRDSIKSSDVLECFAKIAYPSYNKINIADILGKAKRKALLNSVKQQWSLTLTGEDFVLGFIANPKK